MSSLNPEIIVKRDGELSKREIREIFIVYNECFYQNRISKSSQIKLAHQWIGKCKTFTWYYLKFNNRIVGIASYVRNYRHEKQLSLNPAQGENVCSVGILEKYRRKGWARLLMNRMIQDLHGTTNLVMEIKTGNPDHDMLVKFYQSMGFVEKTEGTELEVDTYLIQQKIS